jgi:hypothetical protein
MPWWLVRCYPVNYTVMTQSFTLTRYTVSALVVVLFCFGLFWLDRETHNFTDLFKPGNLFALVLYFIPTFALCALLYRFFEKRNNKNAFTLGLLIGIPTGFALVIVVLSVLMGRL